MALRDLNLNVPRDAEAADFSEPQTLDLDLNDQLRLSHTHRTPPPRLSELARITRDTPIASLHYEDEDGWKEHNVYALRFTSRDLTRLINKGFQLGCGPAVEVINHENGHQYRCTLSEKPGQKWDMQRID